MKKYILILIILLIEPGFSVAQKNWLNRIKRNWSEASHDTTRVLILAEFSNYYKLKRPDSTLYYGHRALKLAREINFPKGKARVLPHISLAYANLGNDSKALQIILKAKNLSEKNNLPFGKAFIMLVMGDIYLRSENYTDALNVLKESNSIFDSLQVKPFAAISNKYIGETYLAMNLTDSALSYCQKAFDMANQFAGRSSYWIYNPIFLSLGKIQNRMDNLDLAMKYFKQSLSKAIESENYFNSNYAIAQQFKRMALPDSSIIYAKQSLEIAEESGFYKHIIEASLLLAALYEKENAQQALFFSRKALDYNDSLNNMVKASLQKTFLDFDEEERQREIEEARLESRNRIRMNAFLGSSFTLLVIAIFLYRNNRLKQRSKRKVEIAYNRLKTTQSQLIQSEKMASLGELTAGIAHEIQNPLNFVNNFSEVNYELIEEMREELKQGNIEEAQQIADDLEENEQKIKHHGQRAEGIVKGMLQHSRTSHDEKEPTDINALANEYLRLAYHGLRAKDKSFNADFKTDFDESIPKVEVIPQDIGRVLLNLINNAFYVVDKKAKQGIDGYKPEIIVSSKKQDNSIEICVKDNGDGIPDNIKDKIFQPFFTTKPAGSGTGLGLSLSYDIVKAHGGELKVESMDGEGSNFKIQLPII